MFRRATLLLICFCVMAYGQVKAPDTTAGMLNGRFWQNLGSHKVSFIVGIFEGLRVAHLMAELSDDKTAQRIYDAANIDRFSYGEITEELDRLYSDRANTLVPITMMLMHVKKLFAGTLTKIQLEEDLINLRRSYNN
jgi:hypothetical protein